MQYIRTLHQHQHTQVLLAEHPGKYGGQRVVVKRTNLAGASMETRRLAIQEAHLLSKLQHPNIIKCLEHYEEDGFIVIVMEWAELGDLSLAWRRPEGADEPAGSAMVVLIQLLLGLRHLHSLRVIHRDIKTKNILAGLLVPGGRELRVKLSDFGVSRILNTTSRMAQTTIGTPYYSSPEIFAGDPYDAKADIWSLGCVLYELLAGRRPFQSSGLRELGRRVQQCRYEALPKELPYGLRDLVDSMLQPSPERRPTADQLLAHPYVREHCTRLYAILQRREEYPAEFSERLQALQRRLGVQGAAETMVLLMAPDMDTSQCRSEAELVRVAYAAWRRGQRLAECTRSSVDELTMTIRDLHQQRR